MSRGARGLGRCLGPGAIRGHGWTVVPPNAGRRCGYCSRAVRPREGSCVVREVRFNLGTTSTGDAPASSHEMVTVMNSQVRASKWYRDRYKEQAKSQNVG